MGYLATEHDKWYRIKGLIVEEYTVIEIYKNKGTAIPTVIFIDSEGKEYKSSITFFEANYSISKVAELRSLLFDLEQASMKILIELNKNELRNIMKNESRI